MKVVYWILLFVLAFTIFMNFFGYLVGYTAVFFSVFNLIMLAVVLAGALVYVLKIRHLIGDNVSSEVTYDRMEKLIKELAFKELSVTIGKTLFKGVRKIGADGLVRTDIFCWRFCDRDVVADEYFIAINMKNLNLRCVLVNPSDSAVEFGLKGLADSESKVVTTVRESVDPLSGRSNREVLTQPFFVQPSVVKEESTEGDL